jgi:hypothetical protein
VCTKHKIHDAVPQFIALKGNIDTEALELVLKKKRRIEQGISVVISRRMNKADMNVGQLVQTHKVAL